MNLRTTMAAAFTLACITSGAQNPFLQKRYGTPYEIPPFEKFTMDDYREGMLKGMEIEKQEILDIIASTEEPSFENVIVPLDKQLLRLRE